MIRESLADYAHDAWSRWMAHLFKLSVYNQDGSVTIPKGSVERWTRQINTPYCKLPPEEKLSDLKEADKMIQIIVNQKEEE